MCEPALELGVGRAQRRFRVDIEVAREIRRGKKKIANLLRQGRWRAAAQLGLDLGKFLADLGQHVPDVVPVESDLGRFLLQLECALKSWKDQRDAAQRPRRRLQWQTGRRARLGAQKLFLRLDPTPQRFDRVRVQIACAAEDVWMATDKLGCYRLDHAAEVEQSCLLRHPGMKGDLQKQVAELVSQVFDVAAFDRLCDFVGLLNRKRGNRRKRLFGIPRTTAYRITESSHYFNKALNVPRRLHR